MTVNKRVTVRQVARRTSLTQKQAREAVDALIEIWSEELVSGGKIAIDNFLIIETRTIYRAEAGQLRRGEALVPAPQRQRRLTVRPGRALREMLKAYDP